MSNPPLEYAKRELNGGTPPEQIIGYLHRHTSDDISYKNAAAIVNDARNQLDSDPSASDDSRKQDTESPRDSDADSTVSETTQSTDSTGNDSNLDEEIETNVPETPGESSWSA